jgi:hypothetical protein
VRDNLLLPPDVGANVTKNFVFCEGAIVAEEGVTENIVESGITDVIESEPSPVLEAIIVSVLFVPRSRLPKSRESGRIARNPARTCPVPLT